MMALMGVLCALTTVIPFPTEAYVGMRSAIAFETEDLVVVAVVFKPIFSMEEKGKAMSTYAREVSERFGKKAVVTQDLSVYMTLDRMRKRGTDEESAARLLSRLSHIEKYCYSS